MLAEIDSLSTETAFEHLFWKQSQKKGFVTKAYFYLFTEAATGGVQ